MLEGTEGLGTMYHGNTWLGLDISYFRTQSENTCSAMFGGYIVWWTYSHPC